MNKEAFDLLLNNAGGKLAIDFARIKQQQDANSLEARFGRTASGITSAARSAGNAAQGIGSGIAGGARSVGGAAAGLGRSVANEARAIPGQVNAGINSARAGVQSLRAGTNNALAGVRGGVDQMTANMQGRPATPAAAPQSYAQRGIPSSADLPPATPQPPQYFSVNRPQAPGPMQGPGMRGAVTSFDQLPPEFQARFRERVSGGSVRGASDQDAVASYNRHYAGTTGQLRALSQNPRTAYGTQPAPRQTFDQMAGTAPSPGNMATSRLPAASPQAVASR